jgi:hypothetical protein
MGDTEASIITHSSERVSAKRHLKEQLRRVQGLGGVLLPVSSAPAPVREVWLGKGYDLARKVRAELGADWTQPGKFTAALERACQRYVQKNGKPFTPKSLRESLRRKDDEKDGWSRGR